VTTLSQSQLDLYWNVFRNIGNGVTDGYNFDRETLTYVQADPRYLEYLNQYLSGTSLSEEDKARISLVAETVHTQARATLNSSAYSYSTAIQGLANDLYWAVEHEDRDTLGAMANPPAAEPTLVADLSGGTPETTAPTELNIAEALIVTPIAPEDMPYVAPVEVAQADIPEAIGDESRPLEITVTGGMRIGWPLAGTMISGFGDTQAGEPNRGVNIEAPAGTEIHAADEGVVIYAGDGIEGYGNLVIIRHRDTDVHTVYAHLDELNVAKDDVITGGQVIGTVGSTGAVDTPQLHFEIRIGSRETDPEEYIGTPLSAPAAPAFTDYTVERGDNLWKITREHYGLTDNAAIMRAVEHVANANELTGGTDANHIDIGQVLHLPAATSLSGDPATALNWAALDHETKTGAIIRGDFSGIDGGEPIIFSRGATGDEALITIGVRGNLTLTVQAAAAEMGITDLSARDAYLTALRVAEANGITNPGVVSDGREINISRSMFSASPS
jgi:LysM repeat protein